MRNLTLMILLVISLLIIFAGGCRENLNAPAGPDIIRAGTIGPKKNIKIISPEDGDIYHPGQRAFIQWTADSSLPQVNISLYRKNVYQRTIITGLDNSEEYHWVIPMNIDRSTKYRLRIENSLRSNDFDISKFFEILEWDRKKDTIKIRH